jgi:CheY-like chemotaxis protein
VALDRFLFDLVDHPYKGPDFSPLRNGMAMQLYVYGWNPNVRNRTLPIGIVERPAGIGAEAMARVVVVEDETQVLMLAQSILQSAGHDTLSAGTVAEAQSIINSDEKFDLVVTDIQLGAHPEGGFTIGRLVAKTRPGTPVLYTSGRAATDGMESLFVQPSAFLPKPYIGEQLTEAVSNLLALK